MIKIEKMEISGLANALYGMRLPKNSNLLSDSYCLTYNYDNGEIFTIPLNDFNSHNKILRTIIGPKDKKLAENLILAGTDHGKWFRQIQLSFLLTAPMTAWWDIDTYKVATVKNSSSRMHKITSRPLTINDFSYDDKNGKIINNPFRDATILHLNNLIARYNSLPNDSEEKENIFRQIIQDLPQSFNFTSIYTCSAQTARAFYFARRNHKQKELRDLANFFAHLPNAQEISDFITIETK
jgi:hypothetical protein